MLRMTSGNTLVLPARQKGESIVMLSATKHLGLANEILRFAQDDTSGGSLLRLMHLEADNSDEQNCRDIMKNTEGR